MNNPTQITNFLKYLSLHGVSPKSLKYYKSDLVNFLNWSGDRKVTSVLIQEYITSARLTTPTSTLNRRISTLRSYASFMGFKKTANSWQTAILSKFESKQKFHNFLNKLFFSRPDWYRKYHSYQLATYIHVAILVLFTSLAGYALYDQVFRTTSSPLAFPTALTRPNRYLSFQGRLTDNLGNPKTVATNMVFKLYAVSTGGTALWNSGTCSITPDQDGIFSTLLGSSCGAEIASTVFSENASIWLGATIGADAEATPRVQIATVAYALNSETLQGFPAGTGTSTIPYINSTGALVLANASPTIQSTSGTFAVEGLAMTLTTPNTSNGVITVNPDGVGTLNLTFEGTAAGLSANGFVNATNANITSGALYGGTVASAATGYNFVDFQSGVSPTSKFSVSAIGNTTMAGDLTVTGDDLFMTTNTANYFLMADGTNYNPTSPADARTGLGLAAGGTGDIWVEKAGDTMTGALVNTLATGNSLVWDTNTLVVDATNDRVGIGTTGPDAKLDSLSTTEQLRLTYTDGSVYSSHTVDSSGNLTIDNTGTKTVIADNLQVTGGSILNSVGTANIIFSATPTTVANTLSASNWLVENTANLGQAALMVNQTKAGDLFTASASGVPKFVITNAGNVGIGTTGPGSKLDVTTTALGTTQTTSSGLALVNTTAAAAGLQQISPALRWSGLGWKTDATAASQAVDFRAYVTPVQGAAAPTGYLGFESSIGGGAYSATPPFVITTGGNIGIGTTAPSVAKLVVAGNVAISDGGWFGFGDVEERIAGNNAGFLQFFTSGLEKVRIDTNGNVGIGTTGPGYLLTVNSSTPGCNGCTAWTNYSDSRLKENIVNLSGDILDKIMDLKPVTFNYNDAYYSQTGYTRPDGTTPTFTGFVAQDLQQIFPEMVSTAGSGYLDTNLSNLQIYLVKGIQQQQREIASLSGQLAGLLQIDGSCVTGDTMLPIRRRRRRKNSNDEDDDWDYFLCRIDEILPGDEVLSLNESTGALEHARINALKDMDIREVYELTTKSGKVIRTTANHPYLTLTEDDPIANEEKINI